MLNKGAESFKNRANHKEREQIFVGVLVYARVSNFLKGCLEIRTKWINFRNRKGKDNKWRKWFKIIIFIVLCLGGCFIACSIKSWDLSLCS